MDNSTEPKHSEATGEAPATSEVSLDSIVTALARMGVRVTIGSHQVPETDESATLDRTPVTTTGVPVSRLVLEGRE